MGKNCQRIDAKDIVTGKAVFLDDYTVKDALFCAVLKSPLPHANIVSIDTAAAKALPGVHAVLTYEDCDPSWGMGLPPMKPILGKRVHFVGDGVAIVAADTEDIAKAALELIKVEYEELEPVYDAVEATQDGAPQLYDREDLAHNIAPGGWAGMQPDGPWYHIQRGDIEKGFEECDFIAEDFVEFAQKPTPLPPESPGIIAKWEGGDNYLVYGTTQSAFIMTIQNETVIPGFRVHAKSFNVGGSYGSKNALVLPCQYCCLLSKATNGRPVKWMQSKTEHFVIHETRLGSQIKAKMGCDKDGIIRAVQGVWDVGLRLLQLHHPGPDLRGPRRVPAVLRPGRELGSDEQLRHDQQEPRRRGPRLRRPGVERLPVPADDPHHARSQRGPRGGLQEELHPRPARSTSGATASSGPATSPSTTMNPSTWRRKSSIGRTAGRAGGVPSYVSPTAGISAAWACPSAATPTSASPGPRASSTSSPASPSQERHRPPDGRHRERMGQRSNVLKQVAEVLRVPYEMVKITDPDNMFNGVNTGLCGSRGTITCGRAAVKAAQDAAQQLIKLASPILHVEPEFLELYNFGVRSISRPELWVPWNALVPQFCTLTGFGRHMENFSTPSCVSSFVEVEVDTKTGLAKVIDMLSGSDAGQIIDPAALEMQMHGGIGSASLDTALYEENIIDPATGRLLTCNMIDYKWRPFNEFRPSACPCWRTRSTPITSRRSVSAENAGACTASACMMAISNAIGVDIKRYPATPDVILEALGKVQK